MLTACHATTASSSTAAVGSSSWLLWPLLWPLLSEHAAVDVPAHDGSDAGGSAEFTLRHSSSWLTLWGFALFCAFWAAWAEAEAPRTAFWYFQHNLHRFFWPLLLSVPGSSATSRVLPAPAVLPTTTSSTADGLTFLAIDAKWGEGALECLDLGGAHGLHMEIIHFRLPLATRAYLCWTIALLVHDLCLAWTRFETCVWIWTFGL